MNEFPMVSVIMPVRNEAGFIRRSLGAVLAQDYPHDRMEVLVVDGMSDDGTRQIVREMADGRTAPSIRLLDNPARIVPT
ncbi:MAG: glycosyltransferase, partial [Anaerolineae bacterium]